MNHDPCDIRIHYVHTLYIPGNAEAKNFHLLHAYVPILQGYHRNLLNSWLQPEQLHTLYPRCLCKETALIVKVSFPLLFLRAHINMLEIQILVFNFILF